MSDFHSNNFFLHHTPCFYVATILVIILNLFLSYLISRKYFILLLFDREYFKDFLIASGLGLSPLYRGHFWPIVPAPDDR
jgi:hypothetical protein